MHAISVYILFIVHTDVAVPITSGATEYICTPLSVSRKFVGVGISFTDDYKRKFGIFVMYNSLSKLAMHVCGI